MQRRFSSSPATAASRFSRCVLVALLAATGCGGSAPNRGLPRLKILAPAAPGGGWDQTARSMQQVLQSAGIVRSVQVSNVAGAAGAIGLAQFVSGRSGNGESLIVGGLVMMSGTLTGGAQVSLAQTTPIARLTGEAEVLVVPAQSPVQTLEALLSELRRNPGSVSWAGGSAGGTDHLLLGLVAQAAGLDPRQLNYVAFSGGGEAVTALLGHQVAAGVSGLAEFEPHIRSGALRALAVSSRQRPADLPIPTLLEQGIDVELVNWRAVFAPPGISAEQQALLLEMVESMVRSEAWQAVLQRYGWADLFLAGQGFERFLRDEETRVQEALRGIGLLN